MTAAIVGFVALFALLFFGIPVAFGMGIVGVVGFAYVVGWGPAFAMVSQITIDTVFNYNFSVLPLFALMGSVFAHFAHGGRALRFRERFSWASARRPRDGNHSRLRRFQCRVRVVGCLRCDDGTRLRAYRSCGVTATRLVLRPEPLPWGRPWTF